MRDHNTTRSQQEAEAEAAGEGLVGFLVAGAGADGGRVVFEGVPSELLQANNSLTGKHLAARLAAPVNVTTNAIGGSR